MSSAVIMTERLTLEPLGPPHLEGLWAAIESSVEELSRWMAWCVEPKKSETQAFLDGSQRSWEAGTGWNFCLVLDGRAVGTVGIAGHVPLVKSAEIGYWLRSDLAGRGLMTEAASAATRFAFDDLGLHRLELHAGPGNVASIRVAEKLGFKREGLLRDGSYARDGWYDVYVFGLLADDPQPKG
jgi:ribosomal-protein-serine acetyltransferase